MTNDAARRGLTCRVGSGVIAGLAGGVVFGLMMHVSGALPTVAKLVDGQSALIGWAVHMAIAAFVGIVFAVIMVRPPSRHLAVSAVVGAGYGWLWWVLGGLTLMPLRLGMGLFVFNADAWISLAGHLVYGLVLGAVYALVEPTGQPQPASPRRPALPAGHQRRL